MGIISGLVLLKKFYMTDNAKQTFFDLFEYIMAMIEFIGNKKKIFCTIIYNSTF